MRSKEIIKKLKKEIEKNEEALIACDSYEFYKEQEIIKEKLELLKSVLNLIEEQKKEIKFQKRKEELINRVIKGYDNNAIDADTAIGIYKINLRDLSLEILEE